MKTNEVIKNNKQLLGKGLDYIALDRKYIEWLEQKLASTEAKNDSRNSRYIKCADEIQIYYEDHNDVYQSEIIKILKKHRI